MTGKEIWRKIKEIEKELDTFNLVIAEWRVKYGMKPELISLYAIMDGLSLGLQALEAKADFSRYINLLSKYEDATSQ